jgi:hypothetical protein
MHFPKPIDRLPSDPLPVKIINAIKIKKLIRNLLTNISPALLVLAIDNDPISQMFIRESKKTGIKTLLVQESLMRPYQYTLRKKYISNILYNSLRGIGIPLTYIKYGTGLCDAVLASGKIPQKIFIKRGVPANKIFIVGYPKYDTMIEKLKHVKTVENNKPVYLFAASTNIIQDVANTHFLNKLISATIQLGVYLIIKLHPRSSLEPADIYKTIADHNTSLVEIVKEGDDTFSILKQSDVLITVSSTVILEALMMNKECVIVNYLAGESRLDYNEYDAVCTIDSDKDIFDVIKNTSLYRKQRSNKEKLLEDELFKLDGHSGYRSAEIIENLITSNKTS